MVTSRDRAQRFVVSIQHFSTYWSRPVEKFEFGPDDNYNAILAGISGQLGLPVHCLYTSDKLSKIKQTGVLSTKNRVIAAAEHDRVKEESGALGNIGYLTADARQTRRRLSADSRLPTSMQIQADGHGRTDGRKHLPNG